MLMTKLGRKYKQFTASLDAHSVLDNVS